jgi:hypothetical protein
MDQMTVYCDMRIDGSNGGGWAMVATIDGDDQDHSNANAVGDTLISPSTSTTSKYSDATIQCIQSGSGVTSDAGTRFECRGQTQYFKGCEWNSVRGLGDRGVAEERKCIDSYDDNAATQVRSAVACNTGSQGVGSHCGGSHEFMDTYCSHCVNGEYAGDHGRMGCGHDNHDYGHAGALWVR